jgi:hypothetical protein
MVIRSNIIIPISITIALIPNTNSKRYFVYILSVEPELLGVKDGALVMTEQEYEVKELETGNESASASLINEGEIIKNKKIYRRINLTNEMAF